MSGAPSIGAFPQTPVPSRRGPPGSRASSSSTSTKAPGPLPVAPQQGASSVPTSAPVIPLHILDAPTQRLYAFGFYVALLAWKFYDWAQLVEEDTESFWLFLKWIAIDCAFLFGLPELRIPWLELSQPFVVVTFFLHAVFDWLLMFNIGVWRTSQHVWHPRREVQVADSCAVSLAGMGPRLRQGILRPRARHFGTQCQGVEHTTQLFLDHGPPNHQHPPRGVSNAPFWTSPV